MEIFDERLRKIENRLTAIENKLSPHSSLLSLHSSEQSPSLQPPSSQRKPDPKPHISSPLILWFQENWLSSIGIFLIILAISWFIGYAFFNDWIGETTRVFLGFISGVVIYSAGFWSLRKRPKGGQALIILGEAVAISALFAGHEIYSILSTFQAFFLMLVIVSLTTIIAIKNHLENLSISSIVFAIIIPMLLNNDSSNAIFLMLYVLVINATALWMWVRQGWEKTFHIAGLATFAYSFSLARIQEQWIVNFFIWTFYLIFFIPIAFPIYRKKFSSLFLKGTSILLTLNFAFIFWIYRFTDFPWNVISYFAASLLSSALGCLMTRNWSQIEFKDGSLRYVIGGIIGCSALIFTFMATYELTHHLLLYSAAFDITILLFFIEVTTAISISYFILQSPTASSYFSLLFIIPLIAVYESSLSFFYTSFFSLKFAILCTAIVSLYIAAKINQKILMRSEISSDQKLISNLLWIITGVFAAILVWNICHQIFPASSIARAVAQVIYVIAAEILIYIGNMKQLKNLRIGGFAIILFVAAHLLIEDAWLMPIVTRTITFAIIGLLLIGAAFFDKKYRE